MSARTLVVLLAGPLLLAPACARREAADRSAWAEVDGEPILREQVERYYRSRVPAGSDAGNAEQALSFKLNILNELINNQVLVAHAARAGITVSEAEVDTKIAELRSPYTKEEFEKKLSDQGLTLGDLRQELRKSMVVDKLVHKEITSHINVTDAEVAAYYERNRASFNVPETQYHIAQVVVTPLADAEVRNLKNDDAKTTLAAERKVQALYARLRAGEDFAVVAQEFSEDPVTATGGGDKGFIPVSALEPYPQLKQVITSLEVGQVSGIVRASNGYTIFKLLGREEAGQRQLSDPRVQSAIRRTLVNEREQLLKAAYIEDLRNRAKVVNYLAGQIVSAGGTPSSSK